jgi:hypothetical protein
MQLETLEIHQSHQMPKEPTPDRPVHPPEPKPPGPAPAPTKEPPSKPDVFPTEPPKEEPMRMAAADPAGRRGSAGVFYSVVNNGVTATDKLLVLSKPARMVPSVISTVATALTFQHKP